MCVANRETIKTRKGVMSELYFLRINTFEVMHMRDEIRHMNNPFKVTCKEEDTHFDMFNKLRERVADVFKGNESSAKACEDWIKMNEKDVSKEVLEMPVVNNWKEYNGEEYYVWFDMDNCPPTQSKEKLLKLEEEL